MNAKMVLVLLLVALIAVLSPPMASAAGLTMLVVPARYSVIQLGMDIAQHYEAVMVSYQGDASSGKPLIYAWNGQEWVKISLEDYASGAFLQVTPSRAVLVGDENLLPPAMASINSWCARVVRVSSLDTASLVNELAKVFGFRSADWQWFAKRYNLTLQDANGEARKTSWYDRPSYEDEWTAKLKRKGGNGPAAVLAPVSPQEPAPAVVESPLPSLQEATPAPTVEKETRALVPAVTEPILPAQGERPVMQSPGGVAMEKEPATGVSPAGWQEKVVETESPVK
jgi:hypothetical protein